MKRSFLLCLFGAVLFLSGGASAQSIPVVKSLPKVDLGIKIGANFAQIGGDNWEQTYQPGIVGGITLGVHRKKIGIQAEFLLNTSHYTSKNLYDSVNKGDFRATYFDIPVLFEYRLVGGKLLPKIWLMAGPQFSSLMSVKSLNDFSGDAKSTFKSGVFSGVVGAEMRYFKFTLGVRYIMGFTNVNNESVTGLQQSWNNHSMQAYVGFRFL